MRFILVFVLLVLTSCKDDSVIPDSKHIAFGQAQKVSLLDYDDHIMEPFLSGDGEILFFNNLNQSSVNTDLYYALKINDSIFQFAGEVKGVNTDYLEAVASMDHAERFYFVSTRSYDQTLSTVYRGYFYNDSVLNVQLVSGVSKNTGGWINFDVEVSKDGNVLCFVDGRFDSNGGPYESNLVLAVKSGDLFQRTGNEILENVNTNALEYAACFSSDMLELYFTRLESSMPQIYVATRNSPDDAFSAPYKIEEISGFVEAPTLSSDDKILYYHKRENEKHVLYMIKKE